MISKLLTILVASNAVRAAVVEHWWNITWATANPDGLMERTNVLGVNGSWPPPPIVSTQGDTVKVHVYNGLGTVGTSLHTHGMFFNGSNEYDGAVGTTQCAIPPGETLTYEIPTDLQSGTYWIHSHYNNQYTDGLRAPFVVLPAENRTDISYDGEFTVILSDWYHDAAPYLVSSYFLNWINPSGAEPVPKSAAIYIANGTDYLSSISDIASGVGTSSADLNNAFIPVEAGKKYRIRVINMAALAMFYLQIAEHNITIIELDGIEVTPQEIDILPIAVAQRYSFLLETKNSSDTNYAFMAFQNPDMYDAVPDDLVLNNTITLQYNAANAAPEAFNFTDDAWPMFDDTIFVPITAEASAEADVSFTLNFMFDTFNDGTNRASFHVPELWSENITYQMPMVPAITTMMTMGSDANQSAVYGAMTNAIVLSHMDNVEITVVNWDAGNHPFHLHGHEFQIIQKSFDMFSNDTSINPTLVEGQSNPSRRDTISVPSGGFVKLRFRADNPGAWLFHCHIDWHMTSGLAVTFITDPEWSQTQLTIPQTIYDHCEAQGIATSGNVVGLMSTTDFKGQPYGPWPLTMGWTPKAIGALAGCIISAILGVLTIVWYGSGSLEDEALEREILRQQAVKKAKGGKFGAVKSLVAKARA